MKIPKVLEVKQATTLAVAAGVAGIFVAIFGPVIAWLLMAAAFIGLAYAAALKWAPEFFEVRHGR